MTGARKRLLLSPDATRQIKEQAAFYRGESGDELAQRWRSAVNSAIRLLRTNPEAGTPCNFRVPTLARVSRVFVRGFPKHMIFYDWNSETRLLTVIAVLHGARDLEVTLLRQSTSQH